jgi:hypothetical protein
MSTTKQCLACIRTCHRIAREGEGYVATSRRYGLDLTALQMELVNIRRTREQGLRVSVFLRDRRLSASCWIATSLTPLRDIEVIGDMILARLRFVSAIARGVLFGVGANGAGTARAHQIGGTEDAEALYARQSPSSVVRFTSRTHF